MTAVHANGITLETEEKGDKRHPPIILVRGLGTQLIDWPAPLIQGLADKELRVVIFDNRDVGLSSKIDEAGTPDLIKILAQAAAGEPIHPPYTIHDMALDVIGLMDALGISSAHMFGISMGGMIVQTLAARHKDRVLSMISVMSSSGNPSLPPGKPEAMGMLMAKPPDPMDRKGAIAQMANTLRVIGSPGYPEPEEVLWEAAEKRFDRCYCPEGVSRQMAAVIADGSRVELLKTISVPSLVIHGADDPLVPVEGGIDTAAHIPGASLEIIPGMGHSIPKELVPRFIEMISTFILRVRTQKTAPHLLTHN
jgi:pimeloyl-ACP methyl ester carboxylesterase